MPKYPKGARRPRKPWKGPDGPPHIIGTPLTYQQDHKTARRSYSQVFADRHRAQPTPAEKQMRGILENLRIDFAEQYVIHGGVILDFYLRRYRVAIEVDGSIHQSEEVKEKDEKKRALCEWDDIPLIRFTNEEVLKTPQIVIARLRKQLKMDGPTHDEDEGVIEFDTSQTFCDYNEALEYCKQTGGKLTRFGERSWIVHFKS